MKILKLILLTFLVFISATKAAVEVTSGKYVVNNSDLSIKVIGGFLVWEREYRDRQWYFNRPWESLKLNIDNVSGQLKSIQKANDTYTGVDSAGTLFKSGKRRIITKLQDNTFIWKDRDGHITKYDENGRTLSVATQTGAKINLIYNAEGKISGASDVLNNQILWISYDINTGMISSVKDYANIQVNYTWQEINVNADLIRYKLIKVEDSNGKFWDYEYTTNPGRDGRVDLYKITDPKNNIETVNYSGPGIVNYVSDQNDYKKFYKFEYIKARKEYYLKITNADGLVSESWYESNGKLRRKSVNGIDLITVNEDLRKRIETDIYGRVTTREFDEFNNLLKIVYPNGATEEYTYDITNSNVKTYKNRNNILTRYEYDSSGNLIKQTDASGTNVERQILYSYDQYGQVTSISMKVGENNQPLYKQLFYDNYGNVREEIDGRGHSATYTHNSQGKRITATSPLGHTWNYKYDNKSNLTEAKSPKQISTKFEYDEIGLFSKQINPDSSSNGYSYTQYGKVATRTSELGTKESREYNSFGQVSKLTDYSGNEITNSYDIIGRLIKTTFDDGKNIEYTYPQNGNYQNGFGNLFLPIKVQYPTFDVNLKYDSRNRVIQELKTYMLNSQEIEEVKNIKYDDMDNIIEITGDFVLDEKFEYDALNRITKTYVNNTLENQYYYDSRNLLTSFIDANGHKYEYEYDLNSNKVKEIKPMGQFESYTYDDDNHLLSKTDSNGNKIVYSYDIDGRLVKEEFFDSTQSKNKTINYTLNDMGLIEQYDDGVSVGNYTYNLAQQLSTKSVTIDGRTFSHSYTYYNNGLKKTYTGVDGITYQFFYKNNRLENIVIPSEGNINYSDFEWERPQTVSYPGGITKKLSYNGSQNLKSIEVKDAENNIIQNQSYIYDDKGLLASKQTMQGVHQYQYDEKFRVIGATHPSLPAESWEYDNGGNRLKDNLSGLNDWIYNENNQLIDSHLNKFSYDNNGNMIEVLDGNSNVLYGFEYNESKDVKYLSDQNNNNIFEYYYDPFGQRLYKKDIITNEKTYYHYADEGLTYEQDSLGNEINYLYEPHVNLNTEPVLKNVNGSYFYYLNGDLGTPYKIIDKTGVTHLALEYSAFGKTSNYMTLNNHNDNLRFPGQYFDEESGMNYNHSRYYNSQTGRYNQEDKLGVLADYHVYTYALNNPLSYVDPFGEFAVDLCLFYGIGCVSIEVRHEGNCINIYGCASVGVDLPGCSRRGTGCGPNNGPRKHRFPDPDLVDEPIDFPPKPKPKKGKRECLQFPNDQPCSFFAGYSGFGITCRLKVCKLLDTTCKECFDCYE